MVEINKIVVWKGWKIATVLYHKTDGSVIIVGDPEKSEHEEEFVFATGEYLTQIQTFCYEGDYSEGQFGREYRGIEFTTNNGRTFKTGGGDAEHGVILTAPEGEQITNIEAFKVGDPHHKGITSVQVDQV